MTIETTLPHGLRTSLLDSSYKTEYDLNLADLDQNRVTVVTTVAAMPAAGTAGRFIFVQANGQLYYDNGLSYDAAGTAGFATAGSMLVTLPADQALTQSSTVTQDILFGTINYRTGSMAAATLDATGGVIIPAGVTKIKYSSRITFQGVSTTVPVHGLVTSSINHVGTPTEGANQVFYAPGTASGFLSTMTSSSASIDVVAGDVIDTRVLLIGTTFPASIAALSGNLLTARTWMMIEAVG